MQALGYDCKLDFSEYTEQQIKEVINEAQKRMTVDIGVCVDSELHKLFHTQYGYQVGFKEWDEFIKNFQLGKYSITKETIIRQ